MKKMLLAGIAAFALTTGPAMAGGYGAKSDQRADSETMIERQDDSQATLGESDSRMSDSAVTDDQTAELDESADESSDDIVNRTHDALDQAEQGADVGLEPESEGEEIQR